MKCMVEGCDNIGTVEDALGQKMCMDHFDKLCKRDSKNDMEK